MPGCSDWTRYKPSELVTARDSKLVSVWTTVTRIFGVTAPDGSVTVPVIVPVFTCACNRQSALTNSNEANSRLRSIRCSFGGAILLHEPLCIKKEDRLGRCGGVSA